MTRTRRGDISHGAGGALSRDPLALLERGQRLAIDSWLGGGRFGILLTGDAWLADELFGALYPAAGHAFGLAESVEVEAVSSLNGCRVLARAWCSDDVHPALLRLCTVVLRLGTTQTTASHGSMRHVAGAVRHPDPVDGTLAMLAAHGIADHGLDVGAAYLALDLAPRCPDVVEVVRHLVALPRVGEGSRSDDEDSTTPGMEPSDAEAPEAPADDAFDQPTADLRPSDATDDGDDGDDDAVTEPNDGSAPATSGGSRGPESCADDRRPSDDPPGDDDRRDQLIAADADGVDESAEQQESDATVQPAPVADRSPAPGIDQLSDEAIDDVAGAVDPEAMELRRTAVQGEPGADTGALEPGSRTAIDAALTARRSRSLASAHHRGRRNAFSTSSQSGSSMRDVPLERAEGRLAIVATVRRATLRRALAGAGADAARADPGQLIRREDLRGTLRRRRGGVHTIVIVDGSSSMGVTGFGQARSAADVALARIASERGSASVIVAAGLTARVLLPSTTSATRIRSAIGGLVPDGGTPLADAALLAAELCGPHPRSRLRVLILSDARATVSSDGRTDARIVRDDLVICLRQLGALVDRIILVPTGSTRLPPLDRDLDQFTSAGVLVVSAAPARKSS
ncbi:VWA domain-containing protein [Agreia sp. COWG]|uniref:VWA domain-containing protein n=1 Tax=Agreia sp. COWG TaxID=2773266 RepID=UPI0019263F46|nr:VWA domain-containing protein [Agreia sp. COWG]CAD5995150.1 putative VWFA domain-containing protein [Agreia sp. COWG]